MQTIKFPERPRSSLTVVRTPNRRRCSHSSLELDTHTRKMACKHCACVIEPFDYLVSVANKESHLRSEEMVLADEVKRKRDELDDVKRKLANAKAQLNRVRKQVNNEK